MKKFFFNLFIKIVDKILPPDHEHDWDEKLISSSERSWKSGRYRPFYVDQCRICGTVRKHRTPDQAVDIILSKLKVCIILLVAICLITVIAEMEILHIIHETRNDLFQIFDAADKDQQNTHIKIMNELKSTREELRKPL